MPHVVVRLYPGRSKQQKADLADAVTKAVMSATGCGSDSVSVGIEDVEASDWADKVYVPDIVGKPETIFKKPGYDPR
jgi:4-oxalocrotonate tautomerase